MNYYTHTDTLSNEVTCIVRKDGDLFAFIPIDTGNIDYQQYLSWVEEGNTAPAWKPEEHDLPIVTPQ